ncbi:Arginine ABC transporter permease protein ArtM [Beauveria bassiana D1-5]|uniref:Arginine ABC transporter permease protein ArtM n=1 Tax=Beauveria bassiana D1-5 TaxID=1245745 RepID=A0A0A2VTZ1_BEABA|nr:Arginine ABC transporter permease protein ArtM [Beauveria bassiana D1-5]
MTVGLAVCALIVGLVLAMIFAVWESAKWRPVAWIGSGLVTLFRGLPEILVVLFIYFGSSQLLLILSDGFTLNLGFTAIPVKMEIENFDVSPFLCGVIALSLLYSAYASQTLRGALKAVPIGQWESGQALGLSKTAIFFRLVMPQMWRHALPGLGNQWLVLLKDTALVSLISVNDLMLQTKSIATRTQEPFTWYVIAAAIYLVITLLKLMKGLHTSLTLTAASIAVALVLSLLFTIVLTLKTPGLVHIVRAYITLFTGTPLLVQIFLIYYGPGQFPSLQHYPVLWHLLSEPWLCALIALSLNSAAYTTQLFYGAIRAIPEGQWQSCSALGMSKKDTLAILLPYAFKRALSSYSNEVVLVFKSTSLAYTITLMEVMGYGQLLYGRTYDVTVFGAAGLVYLIVNGLLTLLMRLIERRALAFERRS